MTSSPTSTCSVEPEAFQAPYTDLSPGINLIEASAGTGKTYAIAMLALRFIVEQKLKIDDLLIVTFTKAATEELKERVRSRLAEARQALMEPHAPVDATLQAWLDERVIEPELMRRRLDVALLDIDQAGIFTIHGFCQRVLKEHALESGQLFDSELLDSVQMIRQQVADDFWRQQVYPRSKVQAAALMAAHRTPDALLASVAGINLQGHIQPDPTALDPLLQDFEADMNQAQRALAQSGLSIQGTLRAAIANKQFNKAFSESFDERFQTLLDWSQGQTDTTPDSDTLALLSRDYLLAHLNGNKFKATQKQNGDERKAEFLRTLNLPCDMFDCMTEHQKNITLAFRRALLERLQRTLDHQLQQHNVLSYDDLITRLAQALKHANGTYLKTMLQQRYKAALIDEFQDTDETQWAIFSTLFDSPEHYLYLIGDPKQAIYKFRGADIFSYFDAQAKAQHRFTLKQNWRSNPDLVAAVNYLFSQPKQPFWFERLPFISVQAALSAEQGELRFSHTTVAAPMALWQLTEKPDSKRSFWSSGEAAKHIQAAVVRETLTLLKQAHIQGCSSPPAQATRLQPRDIAILVRSNRNARDYQQALQAAGVPTVINSKESVFASGEAQNLLVLLTAIAHPNDTGLLKQALVLDWFGLDGQAFYRLSQDETQMDEWLLRLQNYHQLWLEKGLMSMLEQLCHQTGLRQTLASGEQAERRLTNFGHLLELLQQASIEESLGLHQTLDWLRTALTVDAAGNEQQLRLESDEDAVHIMTLHGSKGLEYPVVFCPDLWKCNSTSQKHAQPVQCHEAGRTVTDLGSDRFAERQALADDEALAEELRLLYVAVTRAQYRCYLIWADVRSEKKPNASALAYLLFSNGGSLWQDTVAELNVTQQRDRLLAIQKKFPTAFVYQSIPPDTKLDGHYLPATDHARLTARCLTRSLSSDWQMSSYTALAALSQHSSPELPTDKAYEPADEPALEAELPVIPKGAQAGNVIHALLETTSFRTLADPETNLGERRDAACQRYGLALPEPEPLDQLLRATVQTPLCNDDPQFCLAHLNERCCLKEMPFYYAIEQVNTEAINLILSDTATFQRLDQKTLSGYLTGFIDLICLYRGRYYVVDYKSNWLADYSPETMTQAMREHNYGLQYWLYSLVLHQYLQLRLPDFEHSRHFGGVRYLFVRGMNPDEPMSGVFQDRPDSVRLKQLAEALGIVTHE